MGRKSYISHKKKIKAVEKYLRGEGSQESIAHEFGVGCASFRQWLANYESMGPAGLVNTHTNNRYCVELKTAAVEAYLQGQGSLQEICKRLSIRSPKQLRDWIKCIMVIKIFGPLAWGGIYMTKGRKTTLEERIECQLLHSQR